MAAAGSYKLAGFLQKKGAKGMIKGWKKRFFILFPDNIIRYYDEFGFINLNDVEQVRPSATIDHMFEVVTPTRVYELQAGSAEEQESWVSTLKAAMANESAGPAAASSSSTDSSAEVERLRSEVNLLQSDKNTLQSQLSAKDAEIEKLKAELALAKSAKSSSAAAPAAASTDAEPVNQATNKEPKKTVPSDEPLSAVMTLLNSDDEADRLKGIQEGEQTPVFESKLTDMLADSSEAVQEAAARELWSRQKDSHCGKTVESLRDEVRGHSMVDGKSTGMTLTLGPERALKALDVLVKFAPDDEKEQLQTLIDQMVIIESKIDDADPPPGSVEFVETVTKGKYVYEVHRAGCKDHALAFLKKRQVDKKLYYIEVETPEGTFGRDVEGMYDL
mmetsp:Transcript_24154/g.60470  ORF Transcript_24154/g.60470 Transcript_24154/m.60470 type:complete len:389 (+) Transcript_24154:150-1316(+)|eukprot:CAMPEP_0177688092 /NCGR_PEP_ID=MMETSP0447-20121125/34478_1 /TAXON_ID=0 /ORGANISM="Stygamoeba regulata, Strain BSH-02190019" /LENGTH=388 /DNA_ID=CAMNT_0019198379 /DNA_START=319 /DNA_END=1485 /DNA_ORIENTATION=-